VKKLRSEIFWISDIEPLRFGIMARPRAGDWLEDEIAGWKADGVAAVVSLLQPYEVTELGLDSEAALCTASGIRFISHPVTDRGVPETSETFLTRYDGIGPF
jgi:hypothetical protein